MKKRKQYLICTLWEDGSKTWEVCKRKEFERLKGLHFALVPNYPDALRPVKEYHGVVTGWMVVPSLLKKLRAKK